MKQYISLQLPERTEESLKKLRKFSFGADIGFQGFLNMKL
jgi:hypothetical protein